ncbi:hypothetical protein N7451_004720 [Penicillium sp. IBT 35674x]|nr:hypothetical protein N7451_004720 [Penicillium sp. IBT 35674x]
MVFPTLAVDQLCLADVEKAFHLTESNDTNWSRFQIPFMIPENCWSYLSDIDTSISNSDGLHEISLQQRLVFLLAAVYSTAPEDPRFPDLTQIPISGKCRLSFQPIVYEREMCRLEGSPDLSLWYQLDAGEEGLDISFIIMDTKKGQSDLGVPQALAYMGQSFHSTPTSALIIFLGMIHRQRRYEGMVEHTIFGLSTDHNHFRFLQINTEGKWSQLALDYSSQRQEIIDTLAYLHRHASILSTLPSSRESRNISNSQMEGGLLAATHSRGKLNKTWFTFQANGCNSDDSSSDE